LNEAQLLREVLGVAAKHKVLAYHSYGPPVSTKGFPDLVIVGEHGVIFAELKSDDGETSAEQDLWIWTLAAAGFPCQLWRPEDLDSGEIEQLIRSVALSCLYADENHHIAVPAVAAASTHRGKALPSHAWGPDPDAGYPIA